MVFFLTFAAVVPVQAQFTVFGTVTGNAGAPVDSVEVSLEDNLGTPIGIPPTLTNAGGFFSIVGLPPGSYSVILEPMFQDHLLSKTAGFSISNGNVSLNIALDPGVVLSGIVSDSTGVGIFNIDLNVRNLDTGDRLTLPGDNTDINGFYDVIVPAAKLSLDFRGVDSLTAQWIPINIKPVNVVGDTQVDVILIEGIFVSGVIRDDLGALVMGANLDFIDSATGIKFAAPGDNTDSLGAYAVHIPALTYDVRVKAPVINQLISLEVLSVPIFSGTTTLNYTVNHGLVLSGNVKNTSLINLFDVDVDAEESATGESLFLGFDNTDTFGNYVVVVPPGTYDLFYKAPLSQVLAISKIPDVTVAVDTTINVTLLPGVILSGVVTDTLGVPVVGADIDAKIIGTTISIPLLGDVTGALGTYSTIMPAGVYNLEFEPLLAHKLVAKKVFGVAVLTNTVFNVTVEPGFSLSGTVTDSVGALVSKVDIISLSTTTASEIFSPGRSDVNGHYEIILPPDNYFLVFVPDPIEIVATAFVEQNFLLNQDRILNIELGALITTDAGENQFPKRMTLHRNVPNPFNPSTVIQYELQQSSPLTMNVYDAQGKLVQTLFSGFQTAGTHFVKWDGRDLRGRSVASGMYFYTAQTPLEANSRKMLLMK